MNRNELKRMLTILGVVFAGIILLAVIGFAGLMFLFELDDDTMEPDEVFSMVSENREVLTAAVADNDFTDALTVEGVAEINIEDDGTIDFYCGGAGFGSSTTYTGFYYNKDGDKTCIDLVDSWVDDKELKRDGKGYTYQEPDRDNGYYTESLGDGFYYYKVWF